MIHYLSWKVNQILISTDQGLFGWTSSYYSGGHLFYQIKDNDLWEWGF